MPLADSDVDRFFDDIAKQVPEARWIHYAHPRSQPALTGKDYARLARHFSEQLIGTKIAAAFDVFSLTEILANAPMLAHQVGDPTLAVGMMLGACGNCSYWTNTLPGWSRRYMDACLAQDWSAASTYHKKLIQWQCEHVAPLLNAGYRHGIVGRALGELSGFLVAGCATRAPYYPVPIQLQTQLQSAFDAFWPDEIRQEYLRENN
jgi:dihydrodipicolinate synthase/N-acetylneuraminate lyase